MNQSSGPVPRSRLVSLIGLPLLVALSWIAAALVAPSSFQDFFIVWPLNSMVATVVGVLILWRRPGHRMGRLLVTVGLMFAASAIVSATTTRIDPYAMRFPRITPALVVVGEALSTLSLVIGSLSVVVRFPTGRRTSRIGLVVEVLIVSVILGQLLATAVPALAADLESVASLPAFGAYPLAALDIALRYRQATGLERAQFRWLIAAAVASGVLVIVMLLFGGQIEVLWSIWIASTFLPTLAVGVAVLRYRLYDIDRLISRSLTYGAMSVVLFGVFFGTNILLQGIISPVIDDNVIATAGSTLLVASLFQPVRRWVQRVVDRRFHRARYDAERTVDAFAGRLRDSVDLSRLVGDLRQTADGAVEPSAAAVWLREPAR